MNKEKILVVEDDRHLNFITCRNLENHGYEAIGAMSLEEAKRVMKDHSFELVLLDMMLPDGSGMDFCKEIREVSFCPIIIVSCISDKETRLKVLEVGADDYILKPADFDELVTKVSVNIRRAKQYSKGRLVTDTLTYKNLVLYVNTREAFVEKENGERLPLRLYPMEYELLHYLIEHAGVLIFYGEIYEVVWKQEYNNDSNTVNVHVSRLKQKLGEEFAGLFHTVRGAGYIFGEIDQKGSKA